MTKKTNKQIQGFLPFLCLCSKPGVQNPDQKKKKKNNPGLVESSLTLTWSLFFYLSWIQTLPPFGFTPDTRLSSSCLLLHFLSVFPVNLFINIYENTTVSDWSLSCHRLLTHQRTFCKSNIKKENFCFYIFPPDLSKTLYVADFF